MKKLYVIELEEINSCKDCYMLDDEWGVDCCGYLDESENVINDSSVKLANCPLTELKPKELEWIDNGDYSITKKHHYTIERINVGKDIAPIYRVFWHGLLLSDRDLLNDAKQFCQEHYNNLF